MLFHLSENWSRKKIIIEKEKIEKGEWQRELSLSLPCTGGGFSLSHLVMEKAFIVLLLAACLSWGLLSGSILEETPPSHDGSTVTVMLARLGLGPGALMNTSGSDDGACDEDAEACDAGREGLGEGETPEDMCWGYEKDCSKEKRLFVPKCGGDSRPW